MVDTKRIEELRALAYASIPATSRKGQQFSGLSFLPEGKEDKEEGELSSDEEAAKLPPALSSVMGMSPFSGVTNSVTASSAHCKTTLKRQTLSVSDFCLANSVEPGATTAVTSEPTKTSLQRLLLSSDLSTTGTSTKLFGSEDLGKTGDAQGLLQLPAAALPLGGIRKEAEAFLASLNLPLCLRPSCLQGEKTDSLVIKFSDEDSDSDGEQQQLGFGQGQLTKNNPENRNLTGNGLLNLGSAAVQNANLSNQSTGGLKSEIDRMKKQIAAMEQMKGRSSKPSKSSPVDVLRQAGPPSSNLGVITGHQNSMSDLESLRQQIAAKESELQQRKLRVGTGIASGNNILCIGSLSGQTGNRPTSASGNRISVLGPSAAKALPVKSMEQFASYRADTRQTGVTEAPAVTLANSKMASEVLWQDVLDPHPDHQQSSALARDLLTSRTINTYTEEREVSESRKRGNFEAVFSENCKILKMASLVDSPQCQLAMLQKSHQKEAVDVPVLNNPALGKVSLQTSSKRKLGETEQAGTCGGVKKQRLVELSSYVQSHSCSNQKSLPTLDSSCSQQQYMTDVSLPSTLNRGSADIGTIELASKEGLLPLCKSRGFSSSPQGASVSSPTLSQSVEPTLAMLSPSAEVGGRSEGPSLGSTENELISYVVGGRTTSNDQFSNKDAAILKAGNMCNLGVDQWKARDRVSQITPQGPNSETEIACALHNGHATSHSIVSTALTSIEGVQSSALKVQMAMAGVPGSVCDDVPSENEGLNSRKERSFQLSQATTSTAIVGRPAGMVLVSENGRELQGKYIGTSSMTVRYPVWSSESQIQNTATGVIQGISDQEVQFRREAIKQLKEEEELIDKELEEAQQHRHKCEARERLARRQHREAQENLRAANVRCSLLHQKRDILAVSIQAAETQYRSDRASIGLPMQQHKGTLVSYGYQGHVKTPSFLSRGEYAVRELQNFDVDPPFSTLQISELQQASGEAYLTGVTRQSESGISHHHNEPLELSSDVQAQNTTDILLASAERTISAEDLYQQLGDLHHCVETRTSQHLDVMETREDNKKQDDETSVDSVSISPVMGEDGLIRQHRAHTPVTKAILTVVNHSSLLSKDEGAGFSPEDIAVQCKVATHSETLQMLSTRGLQKDSLLGFSSASFAVDSEKMALSHLQDKIGCGHKDGNGVSEPSVRSLDGLDGQLYSASMLTPISNINEIQQYNHAQENHLHRTGHDKLMVNSGDGSTHTGVCALKGLQQTSSKSPFSNFLVNKCVAAASGFTDKPDSLYPLAAELPYISEQDKSPKGVHSHKSHVNVNGKDACFIAQRQLHSEDGICVEQNNANKLIVQRKDKEGQRTSHMYTENATLKLPAMPSFIVSTSLEAAIQETTITSHEGPKADSKGNNQDFSSAKYSSCNSVVEMSDETMKDSLTDSMNIASQSTEEPFGAETQEQLCKTVIYSMQQDQFLANLEPSTEASEQYEFGAAQKLGKDSIGLEDTSYFKMHVNTHALNGNKSELHVMDKIFSSKKADHVGGTFEMLITGDNDNALIVAGTSLVQSNVNSVSQGFGSSAFDRDMDRKGEQTDRSLMAGFQQGTNRLCDAVLLEKFQRVEEVQEEEAHLPGLSPLDMRCFVSETQSNSEREREREREVEQLHSEKKHPLAGEVGREVELYDSSCTFAIEVELSKNKVPPSKFKVLFSCVQGLILCTNESSVVAGEKDLPSSQVDWATISVPCSYKSPLIMFRSYRICPQFSSIFHLPIRSDSWSHCIDPFKPICKFEHRGRCNNDDCPWQHKKDYILSPIQLLNQIQGYTEYGISGFEIDNRRLMERNSKVSELSESGFSEEGIILANQTTGEHIITRPVISENMSLSKWSSQMTKPPVYRIGSYLIKGDTLLTLGPVTTCTQQFWKLGFCQSFSMPLPVHRQLPLDMPCLLSSSVTEALAGSTIASPLRLPSSASGSKRLQAEAEEHLFKDLEDVESWLEVALSFIDFDVNVEKSEGRKSALYVLSRALESEPNSVALWIVYLHMFYKREKNIGKDDMFLQAVLYNKGSYVLWLLFINSRRHLAHKLEAFQMAITALGDTYKSKENPGNEHSSFLLDLVLQMLNCMCMSGLIQEAICWIDGLIPSASENVQGNELDAIDSKSVLLTSLSKHDASILWVCCGYIVAQGQLPDSIIERLGCTQLLPLGLNWEKRETTKACKEHVMMLMHAAASHGRGCLALDDLDLSFDKDTRLAMQALAVNFVECAAACEGVDRALTMGKKFMELYPTSVELVLVCVHLEEAHEGKKAGLNIFEAALLHWPHDEPGILRLWSQYVGHAYGIAGKDYVKALLARCHTQIVRNDPSRSGSKGEVMGALYPPSYRKLSSDNFTDEQLSSKCSDDDIRQAFQCLPSIVKHQLCGISGAVTRPFSNQDVVFGFLILAFLEVIDGGIVAAQIAADRALKSALNEEDVRHCLKEIAALTLLESANPARLKPSITGCRILGLLDRWFLESRLLTSLQPLSRRLSDSIKKRRVRLFVECLLGPLLTDCSLLNSILETCYGQMLLPEENSSLKEVFDFVEGILEVTPANVPIAASACKIVQCKLNNSNSLAKMAAIFWAISLLINALCQSAPSAPELSWVEAGKMLEQLGVDSLLENFYQRALATYPFSVSLWRRFLVFCDRIGKLPAAIEAVKEYGLMVDLDIGD